MEPIMTEFYMKKISENSSDFIVDDNDLISKPEENFSNMEKLPKYIDCQETLVEMSFIKWLAGFRLQCRKSSVKLNKDIIHGLLSLFHENLLPEVLDCRNKINKSNLLKFYVFQSLLFFRKYHYDMKQPLLDTIYLDKMASLVSYYMDLELMSSRCMKGLEKKISSKIILALYLFLDDSIDFIFDSIFQSYYVFYGSADFGFITLPIFKKLLSQRPIPAKMEFFTYLRYIICFKLWKKTIFSTLNGANKRKEQDEIKILLRKLNPPHDFMDIYQKLKWPNWPKLTMSQSKTSEMLEKDLKNVTFILYNANLSLKECIKDILDVSKENISHLIKLVVKRCKLKFPDMSEIFNEDENIIQKWKIKFDESLKPLIPITGSCNSLSRKIKYNFDDKIVLSKHDIKNNTDNNGIISKDHSIEITNDIIILKEPEKSKYNQKNLIKNEKIALSNNDELSGKNTNIVSLLTNSSEKSIKSLNIVWINNQPFTLTLNDNIEKMFTSNCKENFRNSTNFSFFNKSKKRCRSHSPDQNLRKKIFCETDIEGKESSNSFNNTQLRLNKKYSKQENMYCDEADYLSKNNNQPIIIDNILETKSTIISKNWSIKSLEADFSVTNKLNLDIAMNDSTNSIDKSYTNENLKIQISNNQNEVILNEVPQVYKLSPSTVLDEANSLELKNNLSMLNEIEMKDLNSDVENKILKKENTFSNRDSEELISNFVTEESSLNDNLQMYTVPMNQNVIKFKNSLMEHETDNQDLEVVNVLSPISVNSTDISLNKGPWISDSPLVHVQNYPNDNDRETLQTNKKSSNATSNLINSKTNNNSRSHNIGNNKIVILNHMQLKTPMLSSHFSHKKMDDKDSKTCNLSVPNSAINPLNISTKFISESLNNQNNVVLKSCLDQSLNGFIKEKCIKNNSGCYETNITLMNNIKNLSSNVKKIDSNIMSDEFSEDSIELEFKNLDSQDNMHCTSNLSTSKLIPTNLRPIQILNDFKEFNSNKWSSMKGVMDTSDLQKSPRLLTYPNSLEIIQRPVQSKINSHLNEDHFFLENRNSHQFFYTPIDNYCSTSDSNTSHNFITSESNQFDNRHVKRYVNEISCSDDEFLYSKVGHFEDNQNENQFSENDCNITINQSLPSINKRILYNIVGINSNQPENLHLQSSMNDNLTYSNFNTSTISNLFEDHSKYKESIIEKSVKIQTNPNCKVHYKWPLNKDKDELKLYNQDKKNSNLWCTISNNETQNISFQNIVRCDLNKNISSSFYDGNQSNAILYQSNEQFPDVNSIMVTDLSPSLVSNSDSYDENPSNKLMIEETIDFSLQNNEKSLKIINDENQTSNLSDEGTIDSRNSPSFPSPYEGTLYLFNRGKLFLCMYSQCTNNHHYRVTPSTAERLRHEFTVPFDDFRFNIQYKFKQLLTSKPKKLPKIPALEQLEKRCFCSICNDFDSKLNQNQVMLLKYVDEKEPDIAKSSKKNEQLTLNWKKCLVNRFSTEAVAKQSIYQMIDDMNNHIKHFKFAFTIIFKFKSDSNVNIKTLQRLCESYPDSDSDETLPYPSKEFLNSAHKYFNGKSCETSYQYVIETLPKSYQSNDFNLPSTSHSYNKMESTLYEQSTLQNIQIKHTSNKSQKYFSENLIIPSYQLLKNTDSNSDFSIKNEIDITNAHCKSFTSKFTNLNHTFINDSSNQLITESCSLINSKIKTNDIPYYNRMNNDEIFQTYLQVPNSEFESPTTISYFCSPESIPLDNSVPFCSSNLSANPISNSPSLSDCSIPSLVETMATAVPEHTLLDDSLEAVNAAHNLLMISNRNRYNSSVNETNEQLSNDNIKEFTSVTKSKHQMLDSIHIGRSRKKKDDKKKDKKRKGKL
ncbi:uncharacterized protein LOC126906291 isoform X4 [Daktulosphaira vitifoliae]|nr:uncharacterized protein LOC126906291 isoform X3 [Daktulosphaira vitifoliae]XP_050542765.1 uncharacterized protein LOC126906291 isoform X3 [Daktulosphaira vitifoliae]XP_050542766.1 uncharacterized protein LOC126906291 isoform X4 [Daktulosphaira vitifoliae]